MFKSKIIYILTFFLVIGIAYAQDFNDYKNLEIESKFSSSLNLDYKEADYKIDYVTANLTFFPKNNEFQTSIYEFKSDPNAKVSFDEGYILFKWDQEINEGALKYNLNSKIKSSTNFKKIKAKIKFPMENIDNLEAYTEESETATSKDPKIIKKAAELAEGEDDLYVVVHKIASWTKENINYSLETLTADVSQNSSWVFENKKGVCDELTALFVAMLRSINIPARFVTGQAYTNVIDGFGNHAWAEVYFPGYGWVTFDPTYGQLGYVDATHIKMKDSLDVKDSSVNYAWRSYGLEISSNELEINSSVVKNGGLYKEELNLNLELLKNEAGPGSFVPVQIEAKNLNNYYLPLTLYLTKAPKETRNHETHILLKPKESKKIFLIVEIPEELSKEFVYTSKIEITDSFNNSVSKELKFGEEYEFYSLKESQDKISKLKAEEEKTYSANIKVECAKDKSFYYEYDNIDILCNVKNIGNKNLKDLDFCYDSKCSKTDLNIGEKKNFEISLDAKEIKKELSVKIENDEVTKNLFLNLNMIKLPNLRIDNLDYPKKIDYNKESEVRFTLVSDSEAKDVIIKLEENTVFDLKAVKGSNDFKVDFKGKNFYNKKLDLIIDYKDQNNKTYSLTQSIDIKVENVPFYIKYWWIGLLIFVAILILIIFGRKTIKIPAPKRGKN